MKGFKDSFVETHGFWPAQENEQIEVSFVRLADMLATFADQATGRGYFSENVHVGTILPRKQKHPQILDGLYRVFWTSGGVSLCAIGYNSDGSNWIAATNWIAPANITDLEASGQWNDFDRLEKVVDFDVYKLGDPAKVSYRNYRGETSIRTITPLKPWYGSTEWHPEPQWFLNAFDHEKDAERDFALADFGAHTPAVKLELIRSVSETPVPSHGGPAAGVAWELRLNGVLIESSYDRYDWFDRDKKGLKPPSTLTRLRDELASALNVSAVAE